METDQDRFGKTRARTWNLLNEKRPQMLNYHWLKSREIRLWENMKNLLGMYVACSL